MYAMHKHFRLSAVTVALLAAFGSAQAQDDEIAELIKPESSVSLGFGTWSQERPQQGIYDDMRDNQVYGLFDADIVKRDDATGTWYKLRATNLGLDNRSVRAEYLRQGNVGITLEYDAITRDNPNTYTTRLRGIGTTTQIVSANATPGPLQTVHLGTKREGVGLGIYKNLAPGLDLNISFKNEEKNGTRAWGRGSAAEFAVEPIDSTIRQLEGTLSYATKTWQLSGGYYGSWYNTDNELITVFSNTLGNAPTYLSQPLNNQAHQVYLNGGYTITPTTRATLKMSYARATQDENLPTQGIAGLSLPGSPSSLDGEVNTTLVQLGLTSRPIKNLSLLANLRYHDVDDDTPVNRFVQRVVAGVIQPCGTGNAQCVDNTPMSYETLTAKLEGTYRLPDGYSVTLGVDERRQDRKVPVSNTLGAGGTDNQRIVPMRSDVDETTWRVEVRRSLSDVLNGSLSYIDARRTGSSYIFAAGPGNGSANGFVDISNQINPLNVADRDRRKVRAMLDWMPLPTLSLQFNLEEGRDDYDTSSAKPFGLQEGSNRLYGIDASYTPNDKWKFTAWYSYDHSEAEQLAARASNAGGNAAIKDYDLEETGHSLGLGMRAEVSSKLKFGADLQWTRTVSKYQQSVTALDGTPGTSTTANFVPGLPDIENRIVRLGIFSIIALDKHSDLRIDVIGERWKTDDWSWMFANGAPFSYGTTTDGTTVTADPTQNSTFIGMRYIYKFQ